MSIWTDLCPTCGRVRHLGQVCSNGFHVEHLHHPDDPPGVIRGPAWRAQYVEDEKSVNYWRQRCINAESESRHRQETIDALQPIVQAAVALCQLNHFLWEDTQELVDFCSAVWDFEIRVEHKKVKKF